MFRSFRQIHSLRLATAMLFAAGQAASIGHFLTVQHAICPEHGELIHLDADDGAHAALHPHGATVAGAGEDAGRHWRAGSEGAAHRHDHCGIAALRRAAVELRSSAAVAERLPELGAVCAAGRAGPVACVDLLSVAPKHSPPTA